MKEEDFVWVKRRAVRGFLELATGALQSLRNILNETESVTPEEAALGDAVYEVQKALNKARIAAEMYFALLK